LFCIISILIRFTSFYFWLRNVILHGKEASVAVVWTSKLSDNRIHKNSKSPAIIGHQWRPRCQEGNCIWHDMGTVCYQRSLATSSFFTWFFWIL